MKKNIDNNVSDNIFLMTPFQILFRHPNRQEKWCVTKGFRTLNRGEYFRGKKRKHRKLMLNKLSVASTR